MIGTKQQQFMKDLMVVAVTFIALGILAFPFVWIILTSIRPSDQLLTRTLQFFSDTITFENYRELLGSGFTRYIWNSLFVCTVAMIITAIISLLTAYSFSRRQFRWRGTLLIFVVFTQLFPYIILVTPVYMIFFRAGLINTYTGLIIAYVAISIPFSVYMLLGYLDSIPKQLDEAAVIDGCSTLQVIFRVILPVAWPGVSVTAIYAFVRSWSDYLFAVIITSQDSLRTVQLGLANFFGEYTTRWDLVMSASVIATLPTLVIFFFLQKRLVTGLAAGAIKQ